MHLSHAEAKALGLDIEAASRASKYSSGRRDDLGGRYFRSTWEANYARYLNWLVEQGVIAKWEYEVDEFEFPVKRGCRFYKPDFKVWDHDGGFCYHEVKGWLDGKSATKLKRMARHYPCIKILVIDRPTYTKFARTFSKILPNWEKAGSRKVSDGDAWASMKAFFESHNIDVSRHV